MSNILLITGPHGAGKDTVENGLRLRRPDIRRIVRHITRAAAAGEVNGEDYHYINNEHFEQLVADDSFAEWSRYPDSSSGTAWNEIMTGCYDDSYSSLTVNFEAMLALREKLHAVGIGTKSLFIGPVDFNTFKLSPDIYLEECRRRIESRGRQNENVADKLSKAALYRNIFFGQANIEYIVNSHGQLDAAIDDVVAKIGGV